MEIPLDERIDGITPSIEQFREFSEAPDNGPVVMVNLLKFKQQASDGSGTGAEAYGRYGAEALKMVQARGGHVIWMGAVGQILVGDPADDWDAAAVVQYPSRKAFLDMVTSPVYVAGHKHREAGLDRQALIACAPLPTA